MAAGKNGFDSKRNNMCCVAEVSLSYSRKIENSELPQISISNEVYEIFYNSWDHNTIALQESFRVMLLNRANRVLGILTASIGGIAGTVVDPKIVFTAALKASATGIILCHNHPSGNTRPSSSDISATRKLKAAGDVLEIEVLDHIIINEEQGMYYSFADNNMI